MFKNNPTWPEPTLTGGDIKWSGGAEGLGEPYVVLSVREKANITLTVRAPWSGELSEFAHVEVEANSSKDPFARDSILTRTSLEILLDFDVEILKEPVLDTESELYGQKVIKINPSDKASMEVRVTNKGNLNDSYELIIEENSILWGWEAFFTKSDSSIAIFWDGAIF